ncbi:HlyD family secretion protein [Klebsiella pneumoniae]|uniref:HlyD family secretion protein n=1 Tax=Klebsiella pneumoniae complex TaxID=3390273 RepID=UPI00292B8BB6|nr:HlyD family secretion protein [Klebsiella pneumoniae]MDV0977423.1 HlyD family secretion protein [Klebsiella pneumoniae]
MKNIKNISLTVAIFIAACVSIYHVSDMQINGLWTRDGRVRADVITLAGEVNGYIKDVAVNDNQFVKKGQLLFTIDDRDYQILAAQSHKEIQSKKYDMNKLGETYNRKHGLSGTVLSREEVSNAGFDYFIAQADYDSAIEKNRRDELNLSKTKIYAPADGYITNLQVHAGDYISNGKNIVSIVKDKSFYVYAYFQEDQLDKIKPGQQVKVTLLNRKIKLSGHVESISRGILDYSNKSTQGELHEVNPTFEWIRLPMRIPVRISLPVNEKNYDLLISGMTCTVTITE